MQTLIATPTLLPKAAKLAQMLWPHHSAALLEAEWLDYLDSGGTVLLAMENGQPIGFAQCSLRHDYVEGTSSSPVGYLEGIFVLPEYRRRGIAHKLLDACQEWTKLQGCRQFASDCTLGNDDSLHFHLACGFAEANRIICFVKQL